MKFQSIMMTTQNEQFSFFPQRGKKEQSCKIMIHRAEENKEQSDKALFVNNIIQQGCVNVTPKLISRTELSEDEKMKPIKFVLQNKQGREKILNKLHNLKGNTKQKGISITKDYTIPARQMIKEFANKSKEKDHLNWKTQTQHREFEELQKTFHESKGAINYTGLITINTAYLSQSYNL